VGLIFGIMENSDLPTSRLPPYPLKPTLAADVPVYWQNHHLAVALYRPQCALCIISTILDLCEIITASRNRIYGGNSFAPSYPSLS
jgi:hypothetical protein